MQVFEDVERQAIVDAISGECEAFYNRDFERWAGFWLQHEDVRRLGTLAGGHVDYQQGWAVPSATVARIMKDYPVPNYTAQSLIRRENMMVRICGNMAWATFDQYAPRTEDSLVNAGLSYQVRVFEKHEGQWKVVFAGHGDTRVEYLDAPTIRVDRNGAIQWMNEAAVDGLPEHPILVRSAGRLRARLQKDDNILREALASIANMTPIDVRRSLSTDHSNITAVPLVFEGRFGDVLHIVWVSWSDGMILICFDDQESREKRLAVARSVYRLSDTQMRLANHIVEGRDLGQAAKQLGISSNTARTHLQRMFEKTKVRSQTALVRVLLSATSPAA